MPQSTAEVLVGAGTLYTADSPEAAPADPSAAPGVNWTEIGYSEDGWVAVIDRTIERITPAEEFDPIAVFQTAREVHVRGVLLQASLANLAIALGGGTIATAAGPPATRTYTFSEGNDAPDKLSVLLRTTAEQTVTAGTELRDWYLEQVISIGAVEVPHSKAPTVSTIAIDFEAEKPASGNPIGTVKELT